MDIKDIFIKNLGISRFTGPSLREAIASAYGQLPDKEKKRINLEIARYAIKAAKDAGELKKHRDTVHPGSLPGTNVLAINHAGPLDVTIEWETSPDGILGLSACHIHSGGDQINVSRVFSDFGENIALVALSGKQGAEIADVWEKGFLSGGAITELIRAAEDQQVAVINMVDGSPLPVMFEWAEKLSAGTVQEIERKTLAMLEGMFGGGADTVWMVLSAGGPIKYSKDLAYYASLVKRVKERYHARVEFLIDFKHVSGPEEALSVLEIPRERPQDIIKPNVEEFIQILVSGGIAEPGALSENTITEEDVRAYALKLREKYNLLGVLVSMGKDGLMLAMKDRIIRGKGIRIKPLCHTAAGDSLKAGFLYALSRGKSFEEAVHTGNLFGAGTASLPGTQTVTPRKLKEIEDLAREQSIAPVVEYIKD